MNIMILGTTNSVGKSTIAREVFYTGFQQDNQDALLLELENTNRGSSGFEGIGKDDIEIKQTTDFKDIFIKFLAWQNVIIDIGASKFDEIFKILFVENPEVFDDIDLIILPYAYSNNKDMVDFTMLLSKMIQHKVDPTKIRIVLNKDFDKEKFENDMSSLFMKDQNIGKVTLNLLQTNKIPYGDHLKVINDQAEILDYLFTKQQLSTHYLQEQNKIDFDKKKLEVTKKHGPRSPEAMELYESRYFQKKVELLVKANYNLFKEITK